MSISAIISPHQVHGSKTQHSRVFKFGKVDPHKPYRPEIPNTPTGCSRFINWHFELQPSYRQFLPVGKGGGKRFNVGNVLAVVDVHVWEKLYLIFVVAVHRIHCIIPVEIFHGRQSGISTVGIGNIRRGVSFKSVIIEVALQNATCCIEEIIIIICSRIRKICKIRKSCSLFGIRISIISNILIQPLLSFGIKGVDKGLVGRHFSELCNGSIL